ncbi:MAG: hypothetical protein IMY72_05590 [Bacteroidetes bacterium]|nr:hypothetical protein [Bacteroidota bacterium]
MIIFLILNKFKSYLKTLKNPWKIVLTIFLTSTAWMYGRLFGELSNKLGRGEIDFITTEEFTSLTLIAILTITFVRVIFPNYKPLKIIFPKYYPLSKMQVYLTSIVNDLITPYFFYLSIFIFTGGFYIFDKGIAFIFGGFIVLLGGHLLRRSIQYLIEFKLKAFAQISFMLVAIIVSTTAFYFSDSSPFNRSYFLLFASLLLFLLGYIQNIAVIESRNNEMSGYSNKSSIGLKLLLNNKKVRLPLIIGLLFKTFILIGDLILFNTKGDHLFDGQIVFWLLASPLIIYTYVFNNIWGFWKNIWLNMELRVGDYKPMIKQGFRLMILPLVVDAVITIPILMLSWNAFEFISLFYTTTAFYLIMLSFIWSLITPRNISSTFQMKGSTSPISLVVAMGGVLLMTTIKLNTWFYILIPAYIVIGGVAYWLSIEIYKDKKYVISNKVMKE